MKLKTLLAGFAFSVCIGAIADPILTVEYLDGKTAKEQLAKVSKITFDGNLNISMAYSDGDSKDLGNVSTVRKIVFADGILSSANQNPSVSIKIYPNPTTESITIEGLEEGQLVNVYSLSGKLAKSTNESVVNVSDLANGEYIVVAGQTVAKLIKK